MAEREIPTVWEDNFKAVPESEIVTSWNDHWRGFVMARFQIGLMIEQMPEKKEGAEQMAKIMDEMVVSNPVLRVPDDEFLDVANGLFEGDWPQWYQNMVSDKFKGKWSTVKMLVIKP